jgi:hypothetical protein
VHTFTEVFLFRAEVLFIKRNVVLSKLAIINIGRHYKKREFAGCSLNIFYWRGDIHHP